MAKLAIVISFLTIIALQTQFIPGEGWKFTVVNNCSYTVWPATAAATSSTGFLLQPGQSHFLDLDYTTDGKLWGRTLCDSSNGKFVCKTGDCGSGQLACQPGAIGMMNLSGTTLFEFKHNGKEDLYDISVVDGYNLPILVVPQSATGCSATGCIFNIDSACPSELKLGGTCRSACSVFGTDQYCCTGAYDQPDSCKPTNYSRVFKNACPRAYIYAYDDNKTTFSCPDSPSYTVTFCPLPSALTRAFSVHPQAPPQPPPPPSPPPPPPPKPLPPPSPPSPPPPKRLPPPSPSVDHSPSGNSRAKRRKNLSRTTLVVVISVMAAIMLSLICLWTWICLRKRKAMERYNVEIDEIRTTESLQFDWNTIRTSTNNFSPQNKLGEGGFGEIYKGKFENGQEVAIKRLSKTSGQGVAEFRTEVVLVAKLQHKNLVKLLGFCVTSKEKILVYEYLPNSSLDRFLFGSAKTAVLDWQTRLNIMIGIARGLQYLHEDSRLKVIHRDMKTSNVLLDESMNPKISDFGLAKLFGADQTQGDTNKIVGTYGYMAPEYAITGRYSVKSDVYSFGVIVLEIVSGQKNRFFGRVQLEEALLDRSWRLWNEGNPLDLVDTLLSKNLPTDDVLKCIHIGLLCIQEDAAERPGMASVVAALSGQSVNLPMPKPPHFFGLASNHGTLDEHNPSPYIYTGRYTITDLCSRD